MNYYLEIVRRVASLSPQFTDGKGLAARSERTGSAQFF